MTLAFHKWILPWKIIRGKLWVVTWFWGMAMLSSHIPVRSSSLCLRYKILVTTFYPFAWELWILMLSHWTDKSVLSSSLLSQHIALLYLEGIIICKEHIDENRMILFCKAVHWFFKSTTWVQKSDLVWFLRRTL